MPLVLALRPVLFLVPFDRLLLLHRLLLFALILVFLSTFVAHGSILSRLIMEAKPRTQLYMPPAECNTFVCRFDWAIVAVQKRRKLWHQAQSRTTYLETICFGIPG